MTYTTQVGDCIKSQIQQEQQKRVGQFEKFNNSGSCSEKSVKVKSCKLAPTQRATRAHATLHQHQQRQELRTADTNCNAFIGRVSATRTRELELEAQQQQTHNYTTSNMNGSSIMQLTLEEVAVENKKVANGVTPHPNTSVVQSRQLQQVQRHRQLSLGEKQLSESEIYSSSSSSSNTAQTSSNCINHKNCRQRQQIQQQQETSWRYARSIASCTQLLSVLLLLVTVHFPSGK
ncbi:uncharacterized protein LOC128855367 [Anastrepha ludens]|uniref:uncharacterized protein LOC128855367 n=1 Tax=Anastrepha ludens TaxID=28586 RepID=UPI0023AF57DC|nr:uncharacterized protein LOC128855367 [Anastrepha ludens]